jgi:glycosyltransferase involved in cell wall biosynthesis
MKIMFISQWYPPENVWVPVAVVNALRASGHEVTVLSGVPHYPSGEVAAGYSAFNPPDEFIDDVSVLRVPEFPYRGQGALGRLAGYASFAVTGTCRALQVGRTCDAVFVYASPATSALPAIALKLLARVPFVLQVQDVWPDSVIDSGFVSNSKALRAIHTLLTAFVSLSYKLSSKVLVISPSAQQLLHERGVPDDKLEILFNWIDDPRNADFAARRAEDSLRVRIGANDGERIFFYAGTMGPAQDLGALITAYSAAQVSEHARLVLVGSGVAFDDLHACAKSVDGVHVLKTVPLDTARRWTNESDIGIVSLADTELHKSTFPSKIQFLAGMGSPLLVRAPGDAAELAERAGAGVGVGASDQASLVDAFRLLSGMPDVDLQELGRSARRWYQESFTRKRATDKLAPILSEL